MTTTPEVEVTDTTDQDQDDTTIIDAEVVETVTVAREVDGALVPVEQSRSDQAIAHAAEEAFRSSGIPGKDEFLALAMQARVMSMSGIVPKALQGKPADTFVVLLTGRDLGIPITSAIRQIHVIDGQPSLAPKLLNARIRKMGLGKIIPGERTERQAAAIAIGPDGTPLGPPTVFTWEMAQQAGLVMADCTPTVHTPKCLNHRTSHWDRCRQGYRTYPTRMLWWRAAGWAAEDYFPEASLGLYSPEELGAVVDVDGVPIDPGTAPLPQGFEAQAQQADGSGTSGEDPGDPDDLALLAGTIAALPDDKRQILGNQWKARHLPKVEALTLNKAAFAWAMVRAHVNDAEKAGTMGDVQPIYPKPPEGQPTPPASPSDAPGPDGGTNPATPPVEPDTGTQGTVSGDSEAGDLPGSDADEAQGEWQREYDAALLACQALPGKSLDRALEERVLIKTGTVEVRAQRLARQLAREAIEQSAEFDAPY